jgi:DNA (cytosine-5)-methyltransferase 1
VGSPARTSAHAGKRAGLHGGTRTRSGLWSYMAEAIATIRPRYVVAENVRGLLSATAASDVEPCPWCLGDTWDREHALRALGGVLGDLADIGGYDVRWCGLRAADVGAPHGRFRIFIAAWPADARRPGLEGCGWTGAGAASFTEPVGGRTAAADTGGEAIGQRAGLCASEPGRIRRARPHNGRLAVADTASDGRHEGRAESAWLVGGSDATERSAAPAADTDGAGSETRGRRQRIRDARRSQPVVDSCTNWGDYEPAIRRWERLTRPAPAPTETGPKGGQRLSPRLPEWMMGLPDGWICDVPGITRNEALKAAGNGVVPQQAAEALRRLLEVVAVAA